MNLDPLSTALSGALVEYGCDRGHVHCLLLPEAVRSLDSTKGVLFGDVACPLCQSELPEVEIPPSHIRGIWWETASKEEVLRLQESGAPRHAVG